MINVWASKVATFKCELALSDMHQFQMAISSVINFGIYTIDGGILKEVWFQAWKICTSSNM